jgi:hypothetical protein
MIARFPDDPSRTSSDEHASVPANGGPKPSEAQGSDFDSVNQGPSGLSV